MGRSLVSVSPLPPVGGRTPGVAVLWLAWLYDRSSREMERVAAYTKSGSLSTTELSLIRTI